MMMENPIETEMEHEIQAGFMQGSTEDLGNTPPKLRSNTYPGTIIGS